MSSLRDYRYRHEFFEPEDAVFRAWDEFNAKA
jgi:hypothetical protein